MKKRIIELDGVRGIAIVLILLWHYVANQLPLQGGGRALSGLVRALSLGWSGVDLFFVLSGLLVTSILIEHRKASNYFPVFIRRRFWRIVPLYALMIGSFIALIMMGIGVRPHFAWLFREPLPFWSYLTFTQNVFMGMRKTFGCNWLGVTWALAVEVQFYVVIAPLVRFCAPRARIPVFLVLACMGPLFRVWDANTFYITMPGRADSLFLGAVLACVLRDDGLVDYIRRGRVVLHTAFWVLFGGVVIEILRPHAFGVLRHTWLAGFYGSLIVIGCVDQQSVIARILRIRVLRYLGVISYATYLFHQAVLGLVVGAMGSTAPPMAGWAGVLATSLSLLITLLLATASYYLVEKKLLLRVREQTYQHAEGE